MQSWTYHNVCTYSLFEAIYIPVFFDRFWSLICLVIHCANNAWKHASAFYMYPEWNVLFYSYARIHKMPLVIDMFAYLIVPAKLTVIGQIFGSQQLKKLLLFMHYKNECLHSVLLYFRIYFQFKYDWPHYNFYHASTSINLNWKKKHWEKNER